MLPTLISIALTLANPIVNQLPVTSRALISSHSISLNNRYSNSFVNDVFRDNILLTLSYMNGKVKAKDGISWEKINSPVEYEFTLNPNEGFAFHDKVVEEYRGRIVKTTNAHFNYSDGFKSDGYLMGDGVCHFASLIYWVARDAGLEAISPRSHDFAAIAEVPKEYGVSIYTNPYDSGGEMQNLYIVNNKEEPVTFVFSYKNDELEVRVEM